MLLFLCLLPFRNKLAEAFEPRLPPLLPETLPLERIVIVCSAAADAPSFFLPPSLFLRLSGSNLDEVSASSPSVDGVSGVVGVVVAMNAAFGVSATRSMLPMESSFLSPPHLGVG